MHYGAFFLESVYDKNCCFSFSKDKNVIQKSIRNKKVGVNVKKKIKKIIVYFMVFVLLTSLFTKRNIEVHQYEAEAVALVDDAAVALVISGFALVMGTYCIASGDAATPTELFIGIFGEDSIPALKAFLHDPLGLQKESVDLDSRLYNIAVHVKKQIQHPVYYDGVMYQYYDSTGTLVSSATLPYAEYYFVEEGFFDTYVYDQSVGEYKLSKKCISAIKSCIGSLKTVVTKLLNPLSDIVDSIVDKVTGGAALTNEDYYIKYGESYSEGMKERHGGYTTIFIENFGDPGTHGAVSITGNLVQLIDTAGNYYYSFFDDETFKKLNNFYSSSGELSVLTNNMTTKLSFVNGSSYLLEQFTSFRHSYNGIFSLTFSGNGFRCVNSDRYGDSYSLFDSSSDVHIINLGKTANIIRGTVQADGSIVYEVMGEANEVDYLDTVDINGTTGVKINGDVTVSDQILENVIDNTQTVEDINEQIADVNDNVVSIDNTISVGLEETKGVLENVWDGIKDVGESVASGFMSLWEWLKKIFDAILSLGTILGIIKDTVLGIPGDIANAVESIVSGIIDLKDAILEAPGEIVDAIESITLTVGDFVVSIPSELTQTITDIKDFIINLPMELLEGLGELLKELFLPDAAFFNGWKNDYNDMLHNKLPYDKYTGFLENLKDIKSAKLEDITIHMYGQDIVIFTWSWYYKYKDDIDAFIRGVTFIALVAFNLDQMYFLIRGTSLKKWNIHLGEQEKANRKK